MTKMVLTLDDKGVFLAFVLALVMLAIGSASAGGIYLGIFYVVSMLYFLVLSAIVTWTGIGFKKRIKQYQVLRGVKNVLANGAAPLVFTLVVYGLGHGSYFAAAGVGFISSVAAITSDKFSSEIGIMANEPTSIVTGKRVKRGTSGGVTLVGLSAGLLGAFLIASILGVSFLAWFWPHLSAGGTQCTGFCSVATAGGAILGIIAIATLCGFAGTIVDSVLGHWEEKGVGNKYTSNFACGIAGGVLGFLLYALLI